VRVDLDADAIRAIRLFQERVLESQRALASYLRREVGSSFRLEGSHLDVDGGYIEESEEASDVGGVRPSGPVAVSGD